MTISGAGKQKGKGTRPRKAGKASQRGGFIRVQAAVAICIGVAFLSALFYWSGVADTTIVQVAAG